MALSVTGDPSAGADGDTLIAWMVGATFAAWKVSGPTETVVLSPVSVAFTVTRYAPGTGGVKSKLEVGEVPDVVPESDEPSRCSITVQTKT